MNEVNIEKEVKILVDEKYYNNLRKAAEKLMGVESRQINYYFDTDKYDLYNNFLMLRIREKNDKYILTLKVVKKFSGNIRTADEIELPVKRNDIQKLMDNPSEFISYYPEIGKTILQNAKITFNRLLYKGSMTTWRMRFPFNNLYFELDKNEYLGVLDYELECEIQDDHSMEIVKKFLCENRIPSQDRIKGKYERFVERSINSQADNQFLK